MSRREPLSDLEAAASFNPGLWLSAFPRSLDRGDADRVRSHIDELISAGRVSAGYGAAFRRREAGLRSLADGETEVHVYRATTTGRLAAGLGIASVLENGLRVDRTWGLPYLPGSSLKGIARSYATLHGADVWGAGARAQDELFGTTERSGLVCFHDAWWIPDGKGTLPFSRDVLTPHHQAWNSRLGSERGEAAPLDTDSPVPVTFLTATGSFLVVLSGPSGWLAAAAELLVLALSAEGVGGKTAAGYGRFEVQRELSDEERAAEEERDRAANARADVLQRLEPPGGLNPGNIADEVIRPWMEAYEDPELQSAVREAATLLWEKRKDLVKRWRKDPRRTQAERRFVDEVVRPAEASEPATSSEPVASSPGRSTTQWVEGVAWIRKKSKKLRLEASVEGLDLRDTAAVNARYEPPDLQRRMEQQLERRFEVEVEVDGNRILGVRER